MASDTWSQILSAEEGRRKGGEERNRRREVREGEYSRSARLEAAKAW